MTDLVLRDIGGPRQIRVDASSRHFWSVRPKAEHVSIVDMEGHVCTSRTDTREGVFVFDNLDSGAYTLIIADPFFKPWKQSAMPGADIKVKLEGSSAVKVCVREPDGTQINVYEANVKMRNVNFSPNEFRIRQPDEPQKGLISGLTPGDYRIVIRVGDRLGGQDVVGLAPGEVRDIDVYLDDVGTVSGQVRFTDGSVAGNIPVSLLRPVPTDTQRSKLLDKMGPAERVLFDTDIEQETTDERGIFRFPVLQPGRYIVHASGLKGSEGVSEVLTLEKREDAKWVELILPRGGFVVGRIVVPYNVSCEGLRLWIGPALADPSRALRSVEATARELKPDGRFEIGPIPPGPAQAYLLLPKQVRQSGRYSESAAGRLDLGTLHIPEGERLERNFEVLDFPGTVRITVLVNGEPAIGASLELFAEGGSRGLALVGETDGEGVFGPALAFPGKLATRVFSPQQGWSHRTPLIVSAAGETKTEIGIDLIEGTLLLLDRETELPLRERFVTLAPVETTLVGEEIRVRRKTDSKGRVGWTLIRGEYRIWLTEENEEPREGWDRSAVVIWNADEPVNAEIRL